jgi:hypothetical protein
MEKPRITEVYLNPKEKQYIVVGEGLPIQVITFESYSDWDSVNDFEGKPLFDVQIDFDDSVKMNNPNDHYQFQYVNLIYDENGSCSTGLDYDNADEIIITNEPIAKLVIKMFNSPQKAERKESYKLWITIERQIQKADGSEEFIDEEVTMSMGHFDTYQEALYRMERVSDECSGDFRE